MRKKILLGTMSCFVFMLLFSLLYQDDSYNDNENWQPLDNKSLQNITVGACNTITPMATKTVCGKARIDECKDSDALNCEKGRWEEACLSENFMDNARGGASMEGGYTNEYCGVFNTGKCLWIVNEEDPSLSYCGLGSAEGEPRSCGITQITEGGC